MSQGKPNWYLDMTVEEALKQRSRELLATTQKSRLWTFFNSPLGLFSLSSIFLGSLSFGYGQLTRYLDSRRVADQLELEIALRIKELKRLTTGPDASRYSHVVYVSLVNQGDVSKFNLRKPIFPEYEKKRTVSLLWQLSLLVHGQEKRDIVTTTQDFLRIDSLILRVRNEAPRDLPDRPTAETNAEEDRLADEEDHMKKDYGQLELLSLVEKLSQMSRWRKDD